MIRRWLAAEALHWQRAFWRAQTYLASHMDDPLAVAECEAAVNDIERRLDLLSIQS